MQYITNNEFVVSSKETALQMATMLIEEQYVVMISREEDLWVLNYEHTYEYNEANRNGVVFLSQYDHDKYFKELDVQDMSQTQIDELLFKLTELGYTITKDDDEEEAPDNDWKSPREVGCVSLPFTQEDEDNE